MASALTDLMPYALIATEQSISREDFAESQRLYALMEKTDATAPALPRLKQTIAQQQQAVAARAEQDKVKTEEDAKRQVELEKTRVAQQQAAQQQAAQQLAAQQARAGRSRQEGRRRSRSRRRRVKPSSAPLPRPRRPRHPRSRRPRRPPVVCARCRRRPRVTRRSRAPATRVAKCRMEITVGTDGTVTAARVVDANPPRVFDREALAAVKKWKFEPIDAPVTTTRTINFRPGG